MQYLMFLLVCAAVALSVTAAVPRSSSSDSSDSSDSSAVVCEDVTSQIECTSTGDTVSCPAPGEISAIAMNTDNSAAACTAGETYNFSGSMVIVSGYCNAIFDVTYEVCTGSSSSSSDSSS